MSVADSFVAAVGDEMGPDFMLLWHEIRPIDDLGQLYDVWFEGSDGASIFTSVKEGCSSARVQCGSFDFGEVPLDAAAKLVAALLRGQTDVRLQGRLWRQLVISVESGGHTFEATTVLGRRELSAWEHTQLSRSKTV